jgi:DNA repair protein RadC
VAPKKNQPLEIAQELAAHDGLISKVARYKFVEEFAHVKGIGPAKAAVILAGIELGRRVTCGVPSKRNSSKLPMTTPDILLNICVMKTMKSFM